MRITVSGEEAHAGSAEVKGLRLFLRVTQPKGDSQMALRAGFAAASLLGVVTTFGTALWVASVGMLVGLVAALVLLELAPRMQSDRGTR